MDFKKMLDTMSQLNESATKGVTKHTAKDGGYGRKGDDETTDDTSPKIGKDTPKGDIFGRTTGEVPASAKTAKEKKGLKEYFNSLDKAIAEGALDDVRARMAQRGAGAPAVQRIGQAAQQRIGQMAGKPVSEMGNQPIPVLDQGNKQAGVGVVTSKNPAVQKMLDQLSPQELQVVMKGQQGQQTGTQQKPMSTSGGATNQPMAETQPEPYRGQDTYLGAKHAEEKAAMAAHKKAGSGAKAHAMYAAMKAADKKKVAEDEMDEGKDEGKPGKNFAKIAKSAGEKYGSKAAGERVAGAVRSKLMKQGKIKEADIPNSGPDMGANLGAGRSQGTFESAKNLPGNQEKIDVAKPKGKIDAKDFAALRNKKKVKESMDNRLKAAHHAGKAHGLSGHSHCGNNYEDMEEARMYHEGYKQGLDECYGQVPIQGLTVADESAQGTVDDMASFGAHTPALEGEMDEGNAFTAALAKTPKGGKFSVAGTTFTDTSNYDSKVFESWDNQLNSLLEEYNTIQEGISVSVSKGQQGAPDSVSVTAQDGDADKLLQIVKHAGLGLFGDEGGPAEVGVSSGDQQHGGVDVVGDHDGMMALIKKSTGGEQPGTLEPVDSEEEGSGQLDMIKQLTQAIGGGASKGEEEEVEEDEEQMGGPSDETSDEYMNQEEEQVAEDNPPDTGAEEFAEIDAETAADNSAASSHGGAQNSNLEEDGEECETCGESKCQCDEEQVEESYANSDDDGFQADIDFMTKMISGGLNKQKSTGQTTAPVIAGQDDRMGYSVKESVSDWKKLAGI